MNQTDRERILLSVKGAEKRISSEIVPVIVDRSGSYEEAIWRGGAIFGGLFATLYVIVSYLGWSQEWGNAQIILLLFLCSMLVGMLLVALIPFLKRNFAGSFLLAEEVGRHARQIFLEKEIFLTRERTGILVLISLFERRVEILADSGISAVVSQEDWDAIMRPLTLLIAEGRIADALVDAIEACALLLIRAGFIVKPDDKNELPDEITYGGEA